VQSTIKGTLGPYGGDLLMVDENGRQTITNDGATVMKVVTLNPARRHYKSNSYSSSTLFTPPPAS
jgi:T-complex protein 1 subunit eta